MTLRILIASLFVCGVALGEGREVTQRPHHRASRPIANNPPAPIVDDVEELGQALNELNTALPQAMDGYSVTPQLRDNDGRAKDLNLRSLFKNNK